MLRKKSQTRLCFEVGMIFIPARASKDGYIVHVLFVDGLLVFPFPFGFTSSAARRS